MTRCMGSLLAARFLYDRMRTPVPRQPLTSAAGLVEALVRVVVREGLDEVSIRSVAREAGISIGTVQYYFATKDDLLLAAYRHVIDGVTARARAIAAGDPSPAVYIRSLLFELLPLDERRRGELQVAIAFTARSGHSAPLAELYAEGYSALVDAIADALRRAAAGGQADPSIDPVRAATQAVALADGLGWHLLCAASALTADDASAALDAYLAGLLPGA